MKLTLHNEGVSGTLFFNIVPLRVEALVTACDYRPHSPTNAYNKDYKLYLSFK